MSAANYIASLKRSNPAIFGASKVQMKVEVLETQIRLAYEAGAKSVRDDLLGRGTGSMPPFFDELFGNKH